MDRWRREGKIDKGEFLSNLLPTFGEKKIRVDPIFFFSIHFFLSLIFFDNQTGEKILFSPIFSFSFSFSLIFSTFKQRVSVSPSLHCISYFFNLKIPYISKNIFKKIIFLTNYFFFTYNIELFIYAIFIYFNANKLSVNINIM